MILSLIFSDQLARKLWTKIILTICLVIRTGYVYCKFLYNYSTQIRIGTKVNPILMRTDLKSNYLFVYGLCRSDRSLKDIE